MEFLISLWLPIVVSAVVLFFASFVAWTVLPHHKPDIRRWPDEDRLLAFIRESGAAPGDYMFPLCQGEDMKSEEGQRRYAAGPWGMVRVYPGQPSMGRNLVITFVFFLVVSLLVAWVGASGLAPGAAFGEVMRVVGVTAILAYTTGGIMYDVWFARPVRAILMDILDGIVYGLISGAIFALMWP